MILLEAGNRILEECVGSCINPEETREPTDVRLCDFDDVSYRVTVEPENLDLMKVSMNMPCYQYIEDKGGKAALDKTYGPYVGEPETSYDITLHIPLNDVEDKPKLINDLKLFKSNITGGIFDHYFQNLLDGTSQEKFKFDLRGDTTIFFCPREDRVIVIFSVDFTEHVDKVIAGVFLQEFVDAR